jgi:hypothetical protein
MDADIRITGIGETGELCAYVRVRLGPILRDPRSDIQGVSLSVDRVTDRGPGGVRCQILVRVHPRLSLSVERSEASARAAIDAAADRLDWALAVCHGLPGARTSSGRGDGAGSRASELREGGARPRG